MSRLPSLHSAFVLGFDGTGVPERLKSGHGYPPFNIEVFVSRENRQERLRITLAVAGFTLEDLDVCIEEPQLLIRGRQVDEKDRTFIHRGIAMRPFQRTFQLAEGMQVASADLTNGLLIVELIRPEPDRVFRRIEINARG